MPCKLQVGEGSGELGTERGENRIQGGFGVAGVLGLSGLEGF